MKINNILSDSAKRKQLVIVLNNDYETQIIQDLNNKFRLIPDMNKRIHDITSDLTDAEKATISQIREQLSFGRARISCYPDYYKSILEVKDFIRCIIDLSPYTLFRDYLISKSRESEFCFPKITDEAYSYTDGIIPCINLFGDIGNHNDYILEIDEYEEFIQDSSKSICTGLQDRINGTCLFVGFNINSLNFQDIIKFLCRKNAEYTSESFLLTNTSDEMYIKRMKLNIINCDYSVFFKVIFNLKTHELTQKLINTEKSSPYKYLDSFDEGDSDIFFGRTYEIEELAKRIKSQNQVHILVSSSGFGKTSLIRAGIIPKIKCTNEYSIYYLRSRSDTYVSIVNEIIRQKDKVNEEYQIETESSYQLIIIDQFEEFFVLGNDDKTKYLDEKLNKLLQKNPKLKLLIIIREDFYTKMIGMTIDSNLNVRKFLLNPFSEKNAKEAIIKPAQLLGYEYENNLVDNIVTDLLDINNFDEKKYAFIDPSQLQIVCFTLVNNLHDGKKITHELYESLNGAKGILADYIDNSFKDFTGEDKEKFRSILKSMVSSVQTKIPVKSQQINDYFKLLNMKDIKKNIDKMLDHLIDARLVRSYTIGGEVFYELTHEYIIKKLNEWMDVESVFIKQTQEKIKLSCDNIYPLYYTFSQTLLEDIEKYRNKLILSDKEKSRILLNIILQKDDIIKYIDTLKFWIINNNNNQIFYEELKTLLENDADSLIGKRRIISCFALYCIYGQHNEKCNNFIISILEKHINPHFNSIYEIFKNMDFNIEYSFIKDCNQLLAKKRTANMVRIVSGVDVVLGIDEKQSKKILQENFLPQQLKRNIPSGIRKWSHSEYWIDIFLVTNKDYAEFYENHIYRENEGMFPVVNLSYREAEDYAKWWNKSIPSEDEWEFAARGRDQRFYPWGNDWPIEEDKKCENEADKYCNTSITGHDGLTKVGIYLKGDSPFGCKDMAGNVWEWTTTFPIVNGKNDTDKVIVKGGSWSLFGVYPWTWYQFYYKRNNGYHNVGFRCVYRVSK